MLADCRSWTVNMHKIVSAMYATAIHIIGGPLTAKRVLQTGRQLRLNASDSGGGCALMIDEEEGMPNLSDGSWCGIG